MSQPTPYTPNADFSQQEANNASGRSTVNTAALDAEFAAIETTLDQTLNNIQLLQRDDGRLGDLLVEIRCLSQDVLNVMGGFNLRGLWVAATAYAVNDICSNGAYTYVCKTAHISGGSFSATNWIQFGFTSGADAAQAAADAQNSKDSAIVSKAAAALSAANAAISAGSATTSATNAANSAYVAAAASGSASSSATSASNSAAAAAASAASISGGAGSGLDADLLDGQQGSYYAPTDNPTFTGMTKAKKITVTDMTLKINSAETGAGYGVIHLNEGVKYYLLLTNLNDALGGYNGLRPMTVNCATGEITFDKVNAPTPPPGTNSDRLATTAFISEAFPKSLAASGWQKLTGGLILQWGTFTTTTSGVTITLPIAFPNAYLVCNPTPITANNPWADVDILSLSQMTIKSWSTAGQIASSGRWFAIGY